MDLTRATRTWEVESQTEAALVYLVRFHRDRHWSCSCPHRTWRLSKESGHCKHIAQVIAREGEGHGNQ
jgi:hypothetical protein